jgi:nitrite reductase (NO-forming)
LGSNRAAAALAAASGSTSRKDATMTMKPVLLVASSAAILLFALGFGVRALCAEEAIHPAPVTATVTKTPPSYRLATPTVIPEQLPPLPQGHVVHIRLALINKTVDIGGGRNYEAWTFNGTVPGPVLHARVGDTIDVELTNTATMGHSIDFHAGLVPNEVGYQTIEPGQTLHFTFVAYYPGAFLYHCGTEPVLLHIANGMYGAIIVDPKGGWGPGQDFVFVQSEFYTEPVPGHPDLLQGDLNKMMHGVADAVTLNGRAMRYIDNPLSVKIDEPVRIFLINAGPNHVSAFHVIGSIFQRVYQGGNPHNLTVGRQTVNIPPGDGAVMELTFYQAGRYTFLTHAMGDSTLGAAGRFIAH